MASAVSYPTDTEVVVARHFAATPALVYRAFTEPALLKRWLLGPPGLVLAECELDLRAGGRYRYLWQRPGSADIVLLGEFREVRPEALLVSREAFEEDWTGGPYQVTILFEAAVGGTLVTHVLTYDTPASCQKNLDYGIPEGMEQNFQLLDTLLASLPN